MSDALERRVFEPRSGNLNNLMEDHCIQPLVVMNNIFVPYLRIGNFDALNPCECKSRIVFGVEHILLGARMKTWANLALSLGHLYKMRFVFFQICTCSIENSLFVFGVCERNWRG